MRDYNYQYFNEEMIENGAFKDFVDTLVSHGLKEDATYYNDIHIRQEEGALIVEWVQVYFDFEGETGRFEFVNDDQQVITEVILPDNSIEYAYSNTNVEAEKKQIFDEWLKEHPTWKQNWMGRWYDAAEELDIKATHIEDE